MYNYTKIYYQLFHLVSVYTVIQMQRKIWVMFSILILLIFIFSIIPPTVTAAPNPKMFLKTRVSFMGDKGGGEIEVTLEGDLASKLRQKIDSDTFVHQRGISGYLDGKVLGAITGGDSELSKYAEAIEDRLEGTSEDPNDELPDGYDEYFKGIEIERSGQDQGVNVIDTEGLIGTSTDSTSRLMITIELKSENIDAKNSNLLTDAYVIYYALFGNLSGAGEVECEDYFQIMMVGFGSYSGPDMGAGGTFTHYRHPVGEYVVYESTYNVLEGKDQKDDKVQYQEFSFMQSPIILLIIFLVFGIITVGVPRYQAHKNKKKKVLWFRILAIVLFLVLLLFFILGFDGLYIWLLGIIFAVVSIVLSTGIYSLGWIKTKPADDAGEEKESYPFEAPKTDLHSQGMVFFEAGDYEEAKSCFGKALVEDQDNEIIWNDLGYIFMKQERYQEALKCFNRALKIKPSYKAARTNLQQAMVGLRKNR
jgi:tetratricopeptide (TPR) repeat protein